MAENSKKNFKCLLSEDVKTENSCKRPKCENCGWEESEAMRRHKHIAKNGLVECKDGLRRFIKKKAEPAKDLGSNLASGV